MSSRENNVCARIYPNEMKILCAAIVRGSFLERHPHQNEEEPSMDFNK